MNLNSTLCFNKYILNRQLVKVNWLVIRGLADQIFYLTGWQNLISHLGEGGDNCFWWVLRQTLCSLEENANYLFHGGVFPLTGSRIPSIPVHLIQELAPYNWKKAAISCEWDNPFEWKTLNFIYDKNIASMSYKLRSLLCYAMVIQHYSTHLPKRLIKAPREVILCQVALLASFFH